MYDERSESPSFSDVQPKWCRATAPLVAHNKTTVSFYTYINIYMYLFTINPCSRVISWRFSMFFFLQFHRIQCFRKPHANVELIKEGRGTAHWGKLYIFDINFFLYKRDSFLQTSHHGPRHYFDVVVFQQTCTILWWTKKKNCCSKSRKGKTRQKNYEEEKEIISNICYN